VRLSQPWFIQTPKGPDPLGTEHRHLHPRQATRICATQPSRTADGCAPGRWHAALSAGEPHLDGRLVKRRCCGPGWVCRDAPMVSGGAPPAAPVAA
jgi:hypothetical protein